MYTVVGRAAKLPPALDWDCWQCIYNVVAPDLIGMYARHAPEGLIIQSDAGGLYLTSRGQLVAVDNIEIVDNPADEVQPLTGKELGQSITRMCRAWLDQKKRAKK